MSGNYYDALAVFIGVLMVVLLVLLVMGILFYVFSGIGLYTMAKSCLLYTSIQQYAEAYYYPESGKSDQPLVKGLSRCSHYPEEEIDELLKSGIKKEEDVVHILA